MTARQAFRALHEKGCFVIPNPWDRGSAKLFAHMGFEALATTSSGAAWTRGKTDYELKLADVLDHLREMVGATDLPINADFESGFAEDLDELAENISLATVTGIAGLSIEDRRQDLGGFHDVPTAVARVRTARQAIDASGRDVMLVARSDILLEDPAIVGGAIDRLVAFAAAGADCLYAPGLRTRQDVETAVRAVSPKPLNVLIQSPWTTLSEMQDIGVRRISVGGSLAMAAWTAVIDAARSLQEGSFDKLRGGEARTFLESSFVGGPNGRGRKAVRSSM